MRISIAIADFDDDAQREYNLSIAQTVEVDPVLVKIVSIQSVSIGRRLLSPAVDVVTFITSSSQGIQSLANAVSSTTFALSLGGSRFNATPFGLSSTGGVTISNNVPTASTPT